MLRTLKEQDANDLHALNKNQLGYDLPLEQTNQTLEKLLNDTDHHFFLGFEDEKTKKLIGYVHAEVYETLYSKTLFNVLGLAVAKKHEKQGIGRQLMTRLEQEAVSREFAGIRLNSGMSRKEAHHFYEAIGFVSHKNQKNFLKLLAI